MNRYYPGDLVKPTQEKMAAQIEAEAQKQLERAPKKRQKTFQEIGEAVGIEREEIDPTERFRNVGALESLDAIASALDKVTYTPAEALNDIYRRLDRKSKEYVESLKKDK
jgi:transcriptional regulator with XRE-family HTH domain